MWLFENKILDSDAIEDYVGFVYCITNLTNDKKYIGKKLFKSTRRVKVKTKTRRKTVVKESDWKEYWGSNVELQNDVESLGRENFKREILHLCKSKGDLSYLELKEQIDREVLLSEEYYNGIIQVKIHKSHLKNIDKKS